MGSSIERGGSSSGHPSGDDGGLCFRRTKPTSPATTPSTRQPRLAIPFFCMLNSALAASLPRSSHRQRVSSLACPSSLISRFITRVGCAGHKKCSSRGYITRRTVGQLWDDQVFSLLHTSACSVLAKLLLANCGGGMNRETHQIQISIPPAFSKDGGHNCLRSNQIGKIAVSGAILDAGPGPSGISMEIPGHYGCQLFPATQ